PTYSSHRQLISLDKCFHFPSQFSSTMIRQLLLLAFLEISSAQASTIPPFLEQIQQPSGPAIEVCYKWRNVSYNTHEEQTREELINQWCWDVSKLFRCEVLYQHKEWVPVVRQHELYIAGCCDGYVFVDGICVEDDTEVKIIDQSSTVSLPEVFVSEVTEHGVTIERVKLLETMLAALEKATPAPLSEVPVQSQNRNYIDHNVELQSLQVASILLNVLAKPSHTTNLPFVSIVPVKESENLSHEFPMTPLQPAANVENEVVKSQDPSDTPLVRLVPAIKVESIDKSEATNHPLSQVTNLLLQTMTDLTEVYLHSMQQLQQLLTRLHESGPTRASLD
ncbi:hypothetical protein PFISCL1PPCAC_6840, partial [Pristionchus fissidentatus]